MSENNFVKRIVKGIRSGKKTPLSDRNIMHPEREWFTSVLIGLVLLGVGTYWSFGVYIQFSSVNLEAIESENETVVYRDNLVEAALFEINRRAQTYDSLKSNIISATPSLTVPEEDPKPRKEEQSDPLVTDVDDLDIRFE